MSDKVREQYDNRPFIEWWNAPPSKPPQMVAFALNVWAASRAAALEEAARAMHPELRSMLSRGEAAAAIRALLTPPKGGAE